MSLECYCGYFIDGEEVRPNECQEDNKCFIPNTSVGQCYLERKIFSDGRVTKRYTCYEILSSDINPLALELTCNRSITDDNPILDVACCNRENYCNRNIQFVEHSTPPQLPPSVTDDATSDPRGSYTWYTACTAPKLTFCVPLKYYAATELTGSVPFPYITAIHSLSFPMTLL